MDPNKKNTAEQALKPALDHVGGINEQLGGVDPLIDETLMRLSGGN